MRAMELWALAIVGVACAACAGSSAPSSTSRVEVDRAASSPAASLIDLRPLTLTYGGLPIARLLADGRTESVGPNPPGEGPFLPGPTLRGDGTILLTKDGFTARIESNGDIYVVSPPGTSPGAQLFGRVVGNRLSYVSGEGVRIDDATLVFDRPGAPNEIATVEGIVDASSRRTALVMYAAYAIDNAIVEPS